VKRFLIGFVFIPLILFLLAGLALAGLRQWAGWRYQDQVYERVSEVPAAPVAIVFGAGYWPGGLSDALADRMDTAIALYEANKINKLLLTGDNRFVEYNEPAAMARYAEAKGVPSQDLVLDYAGRRTYDSCYRAGAIFGVERAILVTQEYHLPRALYTCDHLGVEVVGIKADQRVLLRSRWYEFREVFALAGAWLDLNLIKPLPVLGDPILMDWHQRSGGGS
jgi:SanA protein